MKPKDKTIRKDNYECVYDIPADMSKSASLTCKPKKEKKVIYVISSKKFKDLNSAIAQMIKWDKKGTLSSKAHVYQVVHAIRPKVKKVKKLKKK